MTPVAPTCQLESMPSSVMPLVIRVRISAPMMMPNTLPWPPLKEMPPMAAAAMASCANSAPMVGSAQLRREV